jgi:hypothetical protein
MWSLKALRDVSYANLLGRKLESRYIPAFGETTDYHRRRGTIEGSSDPVGAC